MNTISVDRRNRNAIVFTLESFAVCYSVLQWVAVCCSVLQCVAVCCSVMQCVTACWSAIVFTLELFVLERISSFTWWEAQKRLQQISICWAGGESGGGESLNRLLICIGVLTSRFEETHLLIYMVKSWWTALLLASAPAIKLRTNDSLWPPLTNWYAGLPCQWPGLTKQW